jgi:glutamate/tyrosine decarboxylase-like PLP-dependent enzyme
MPPPSDASTADPYATSAQWSRRFIGLKLFLSLAERGESGYAAMIEHQVRMGDLLRETLTRDGWTIVNDTPLPLVCFTREGLDTSRFLPAFYERQAGWISEVRPGDGAPVLRACITSFRTTPADIERAVSEMTRTARKCCEVHT